MTIVKNQTTSLVSTKNAVRFNGPFTRDDFVPPLTRRTTERLLKLIEGMGNGPLTRDSISLMARDEKVRKIFEYVGQQAAKEAAVKTRDMMITGATRISAGPRASDPDLGTVWLGAGGSERIPGNLDETLAFLEARGGLLSDEEVEMIRAIMEKYVGGNRNVNQAGITRASSNDRAAATRSTRAALDSIVAVRQSTSKLASMNSAHRDFWAKVGH